MLWMILSGTTLAETPTITRIPFTADQLPAVALQAPVEAGISWLDRGGHNVLLIRSAPTRFESPT